MDSWYLDSEVHFQEMQALSKARWWGDAQCPGTVRQWARPWSWCFSLPPGTSWCPGIYHLLVPRHRPKAQIHSWTLPPEEYHNATTLRNTMFHFLTSIHDERLVILAVLSWPQESSNSWWWDNIIKDNLLSLSACLVFWMDNQVPDNILHHWHIVAQPLIQHVEPIQDRIATIQIDCFLFLTSAPQILGKDCLWYCWVEIQGASPGGLSGLAPGKPIDSHR